MKAICDPFKDEPFDWTLKGFAPAWEGLTAAQIAAEKKSVFDVELLWPVAVLKQSAIDSNRAWMRKFLEFTGAWLAPHGKTSLAPSLLRWQMEDGAWAITAATVHHVRLYRRFGVSRILLANQIVASAEIDWIAQEMARDPKFEFYCLVDSVEGAELLAEQLRRIANPPTFRVFVEMGIEGGRAGVRSVRQGLEVAWAVASLAPYLSLVGIETFEGLNQFAPNGFDLARDIIHSAAELLHICVAERLFADKRILFSAGGSSFFDLAAFAMTNDDPATSIQPILRSGCYITHDDEAYGRMFDLLRQRVPQVDAFGPGLIGALEVWAPILSMPEPGTLICALGRRDVGSETRMPRGLKWAQRGSETVHTAPPGLNVISMFDQHSVLSAPAGHKLRIGDLLGFGVSHPCTTFDKWRTLLVVNDSYDVTDVVRTYF